VARVLLLEDEPNIAAIIAFKLRREGHDVRCESELQTGMEAATSFQPQVILLDTGLEGDAYALIRPLADRCPVLALTEARDPGSGARAVRQGAASTVQKPFKPTVLARVVAQLVEV
jgi:two-component system, OmpR family, phosphate regulon response regulator PhoB